MFVDSQFGYTFNMVFDALKTDIHRLRQRILYLIDFMPK